MSKIARVAAAALCIADWTASAGSSQHAARLSGNPELRVARESLIQPSIRLKYLVIVPPSARKDIRWHGTDGERMLVDGPTLYRFHHRGGWDEYLFFFLTDRVDVLTDESDSLSFTAGPLFDGATPRNDGYVQCRQALRRLVIQFGREHARQAIAKDLGNDQTESSALGE